MTPTILVINESSILTERQVKLTVAALQKQINRDLAPTWGYKANIEFDKNKTKDPNCWWIVLMDNSNDPGAEGYHDCNNPKGNPISKVFVKDDNKLNLEWTITASHELIEMLGDPWINQASYETGKDGHLMLYCWELCDACEKDSFGYTINGIAVSDFVTPEWFGGRNTKYFDFRKHITKPYELLDEGYIGIWTKKKGWVDITQGELKGRLDPSRPRDRWNIRLIPRYNDFVMNSKIEQNNS